MTAGQVARQGGGHPDRGGPAHPSSSPVLIRTRGVTRVYRQGELEVHALRGVDLDVDEGEFSALAGPSGSGKTTLLNMIGVLDHPTAGTVELDGTDVSTMGRGEAARFRLERVGFIFQAYNLVPVLTAYENAEFTLLLRGVEARERRAVVEPLLERVGLAEMMGRKPHELSGGQQQRVAVVRALASTPRVVLADEPTANLDSATSADLLDLMLELNRDLGTTFLFSSHDPVVLERARRVIRLRDGRVEDAGGGDGREDRRASGGDAGGPVGRDAVRGEGPSGEGGRSPVDAGGDVG